jgi:hypothetical protein
MKAEVWPAQGCCGSARWRALPERLFCLKFKLHARLQYARQKYIFVNTLNAELNPICHLLVLLGDLTHMGLCIVSIFQSTCISNKMQSNTVYLYLETALHVLGSISTHYQELIQLHQQHLVFVIPLLLSAAIVEELEPV